ncbi:MAG: hypothetical protein KAS86_00595, partial [Candidatus Omnitrophica bacterium]|nr:hypothetical protein [Candidatus Omnitrophota bacterium]
IFGKFIMIKKNTMYIVSSSQKTLLKDILAKKLALLFGNFEVMEINGFDDQTARSFIADKIPDTAVPENIISYMIQLSQGSPFYLETILKHFSATMKAKGKNAAGHKECLLDALAGLLYESDGIFNQYFTNNINFFLEKKTRKKFIPVLVSLARGNTTISSMRDERGKADRELGEKLHKLQKMDLISKSGVFYKIQDRLFEFWLRNVYDLKASAMVDDLDIKYLEFKKLIDDDFREYCEFRSKTFPDVVCELFASFRGQKALLSMHERKLPFFDSIEKRQVSENVARIAGRAGNKIWSCHIKQDDLTDEHDINLLSGLKTGDDELKITRRIMIPLKGIEHNAFLLAKEKNIWVWDVRELNKMLRLFGKYELVL